MLWHYAKGKPKEQLEVEGERREIIEWGEGDDDQWSKKDVRTPRRRLHHERAITSPYSYGVRYQTGDFVSTHVSTFRPFDRHG